ncbi:hypothetical protein BD626DRAFT_569785 [Schizophyllum amplum]|uniref:Uncharacterized protein n=1 Tax=Schizophyllum amplum TaxID=97359 RepID=A0A550CCX0_9AGAR|nr:hypothetical protein BD626DRAFT_569785 [Auriculariopsis ampla]
MEIDRTHFLAPPPPYEGPAPSSPALTNEDAPTTERITPRGAQSAPALSGEPEQRCDVAARLPAYRRVGYGRFRTHPYRRAPKPQAVDEEDDLDLNREALTIMDVISSPGYTSAAPFPEYLYPVLTNNPHGWENLSRTERADRLTQRIADIDAALCDVDFLGVNELESRIIDFALFVRRNLTERREEVLFTGNNFF